VRHFSRGRTHSSDLNNGDSLDFGAFYWLIKKTRLLLFAEMKVPGEAWLNLELIKPTPYIKLLLSDRTVFGADILVCDVTVSFFIFDGMMKLVQI
jgi:hypothetical protein